MRINIHTHVTREGSRLKFLNKLILA